MPDKSTFAGTAEEAKKQAAAIIEAMEQKEAVKAVKAEAKQVEAS